MQETATGRLIGASEPCAYYRPGRLGPPSIVLVSRAVSALGRHYPIIFTFLASLMLALSASCNGAPSAVFTELAEARRLTADLRVQFNKAADASDRAVMADTDPASIAFAHEANEATAAVQKDVAELGPHVHSLGHPTAIDALDAFQKHLKEYLTLDGSILELAVENTNLKAQRLTFGPARQAADSFRDALLTIANDALPKDRCRADALVSKALLSVRDIQVLQAPHIAESDDAAMTRMEGQMASLESAARDALKGLAGLVDAKGGPDLSFALVSLDRFKDVSSQVVTLSRRNSNVRSLALSLREKPVLTAACDDSLRALEEALAKEGFTATR
jgi:hypothetical protein